MLENHPVTGARSNAVDKQFNYLTALNSQTNIRYSGDDRVVKISLVIAAKQDDV